MRFISVSQCVSCVCVWVWMVGAGRVLVHCLTNLLQQFSSDWKPQTKDSGTKLCNSSASKLFQRWPHLQGSGTSAILKDLMNIWRHWVSTLSDKYGSMLHPASAAGEMGIVGQNHATLSEGIWHLCQIIAGGGAFVHYYREHMTAHYNCVGVVERLIKNISLPSSQFPTKITQAPNFI